MYVDHFIVSMSSLLMLMKGGGTGWSESEDIQCIDVRTK